MRNDDGAVKGVHQEAKPKDTRASLSFDWASHGDSDGGGEVAPVSEYTEGAVKANGSEVTVVGIATHGHEAVLFGAEAGAITEIGLVHGICRGSAEGSLIGVDTLAKQPHHGFGETLGDVGGWCQTEPKDVLDDPRRNVAALAGSEPEKSGLVPLARVGGNLVEEKLEIVGELKQRKAENEGGIAKNGDVVGEVGEVGFNLWYPM